MKVRYDVIEQYQEQTAQQKPMSAGTKFHLPQLSAPSMDGMMSDHTDAATMIPDAKPRNSVFTLSDISLLKNQTIALPAVVARKMTKNPKIIIAV